MVQILTKLRTRSKIRRTTTTLQTLSVDCEAETNTDSVGGGGEGGMDRVEFSVSVNGGAASVTTVTERSIRTPNYSDQDSWDPGVASGMKPFYGWGTVINCAALAGGEIVVTVTAYSTAGTSTVVGSVTIYNDTDGVDRRPSTRVVYVSPTGDDANTGYSSSAPRLNLAKAFNSVCANPAGSSSADRDCSGGRIIMMTGAHIWAGGAYGGIDDWHTTKEAVSIEFQAGATISSAADYPERYLICRGVSGVGRCDMRFIGGEWLSGGGGVIYLPSGIECDVWADGCDGGSIYWNETTKKYSVRFLEDNSEFFVFDGPGSSLGRRFGSCVRKRGCTTGFHGWTDIHDFVILNWLGVAIQGVTEAGCSANGGLFTGNRYRYPDVLGEVAHTGGSNLIVTVPVAGQMRIDSLSSSYDFGTSFAEIAGTTTWKCQTTGFTSGGNNGILAVLSAGTNGSGNPYVILSNASAVAETGGASARLETYWDGSNPKDIYENKIHGDALQVNTALDGSVYSHMRVEDATNIQVIATNGNNLTNCLFLEWCNAAADGQVFNFTVSSFTNCLFINITTNSSWNFTTSGETFTNSRAIECVIKATSDFPTGFAIDCHFITGSTFGTNATSGTWFENDPTVDPWTVEPTAGNLGTATPVIPHSSEWYWPGAGGATRGCHKAVGTGDWSVVSGGTSSLSIPVPTSSASGICKKVGSSTASILMPTMSASASTKRVGSSSLNALIPTLSCSGLAGRKATSSLSSLLPRLTASSIIRRTGSSAINIPIPTVGGQGKYNQDGSSSITILIPTFEASAPNVVTSKNSNLEITKSSFVLSATGSVGRDGNFAASIRLPSLGAVGNKVFPGTALIEIPFPFIVATTVGNLNGIANISIVLPSLDTEGNKIITGSSSISIMTPVMNVAATNSRLGTVGFSARVSVDVRVSSTVSVDVAFHTDNG